MKTTRALWITLLVSVAIAVSVTGCDEDKNGPAPVEGATDSPVSDNCTAYLKCEKLCDDARCISACEEATLAPVAHCEAEWCASLLEMCDEGNNFACAELPECGGYEATTSSGDSSTSTSSSSSSSGSDSSESSSSGDSSSNTTGEDSSSSSEGSTTT